MKRPTTHRPQAPITAQYNKNLVLENNELQQAPLLHDLS